MEVNFVSNVLRLVQILWALLITALIGNVIANDANAASSAKAAVNFTLFVTVVAWIASIYGFVSSFVTAIALPIVTLAFDFAAVVFTFISAVVLSAKLKAVNCADLSGQPDDYIAFGSSNDTKQCREIQASITFMWFLFACFAGTMFFAFKAFQSGGGSVRSGPPNMSQIGV